MMSPLLIECARACPSLESLRRLTERGVDWDALAEQADRHGLGPLVYWHLNEACPQTVPDALRHSFRQNAHRNLLLTAELFKLLDIFKAASIHAVPFKGPALAWSLYESPALRQMTDLDALVRPADAERAVRTLESAGYAPSCVTSDRRFFHWNRELPLSSPDRLVAVDLHWALAPAHFEFAIDLEGFWSRLASVNVAGREVPALAPSDLLVFLCLHGAKHGWSSLCWLADVARLIERATIDWEAVLSYAERRRVTRILALGLLLSHDLLGAPVPGEVVVRLRAVKRGRALASAACERLRVDAPPSDGVLPQLELIDRTRDKLRFLAGNLEPAPADLSDLGIPPVLFPVYYVARPIRLAVKHALLAARRALG